MLVQIYVYIYMYAWSLSHTHASGHECKESTWLNRGVSPESSPERAHLVEEEAIRISILKPNSQKTSVTFTDSHRFVSCTDIQIEAPND